GRPRLRRSARGRSARTGRSCLLLGGIGRYGDQWGGSGDGLGYSLDAGGGRDHTSGTPRARGAALGPAECENREGDIMSTTSTSHPTTRTGRTDPAPVPRPGRALRPRGGMRLLAPLAGMASATALVTGCGAEEPTDPEDTPAQEEAPPGEDDNEDGDYGGGEVGGQDTEDGGEVYGSDDTDDGPVDT